MKAVVAALAVCGLALTVGMPAPAQADGWHRHDYRHWHGGPKVRSGITFHFGSAFPYRYRPYHRPPRVVYRYAPPPMIVYREPPPVVVYRPAPPPVVYAPPAVSAVPTSPAYTDSRGRTCREYQATGTVGGTGQPLWGTACLQPDGSWRIVR